MLVKNAKQTSLVDTTVPNAVWVNNKPGAIVANAKAGGLGAENGDAEFL